MKRIALIAASAILIIGIAGAAFALTGSSGSPDAKPALVLACLKAQVAPELTSDTDESTHLPVYGMTWSDGNTVTLGLFPSDSMMRLARDFGGSAGYGHFSHSGHWQVGYTQTPTREQSALVAACI